LLNQQNLNHDGIYSCTGIYFFKSAVFSDFIIYLVCDFVIQSACTHRLSSSPCQLLSHKMSHHKKGIFFCFSLMMALA
jgi:hypothetical protein